MLLQGTSNPMGFEIRSCIGSVVKVPGLNEHCDKFKQLSDYFMRDISTHDCEQKSHSVAS